MLFAFEGTGSEFGGFPVVVGVRADFRAHDSFVWQFCKGYVSDFPQFAQYIPGPRGDGLNVDVCFGEACGILDAKMRVYPKARLDIVGYSRGGFLAMSLARYAAMVHHRRVHFLGLFDAVRMCKLWGGFDTDVVPGNVDYVCHVIRNPQVGSHLDWGNTGQGYESGVKKYDQDLFMTSHSGMGGWPGGGDVKVYQNQSEKAESERAGTYMATSAAQRGVFSGSLTPRPF